MNNITKDLEPLKNKLRNHPLYNNIDSIEDLKIFSNDHINHVFLTLCNIKNIDHLTIFENDLEFNFENTIKKITNFLN